MTMLRALIWRWVILLGVLGWRFKPESSISQILLESAAPFDQYAIRVNKNAVLGETVETLTGVNQTIAAVIGVKYVDNSGLAEQRR